MSQRRGLNGYVLLAVLAIITVFVASAGCTTAPACDALQCRPGQVLVCGKKCVNQVPQGRPCSIDPCADDGYCAGAASCRVFLGGSPTCQPAGALAQECDPDPNLNAPGIEVCSSGLFCRSTSLPGCGSGAPRCAFHQTQESSCDSDYAKPSCNRVKRGFSAFTGRWRQFAGSSAASMPTVRAIQTTRVLTRLLSSMAFRYLQTFATSAASLVTPIAASNILAATVLSARAVVEAKVPAAIQRDTRAARRRTAAVDRPKHARAEMRPRRERVVRATSSINIATRRTIVAAASIAPTTYARRRSMARAGLIKTAPAFRARAASARSR